HNLKVIGSNPIPATKFVPAYRGFQESRPHRAAFFFGAGRHLVATAYIAARSAVLGSRQKQEQGREVGQDPVSSQAVQRFCKPLDGSSILSPGTSQHTEIFNYQKLTERLPFNSCCTCCKKFPFIFNGS
ncbi:MAG: hypothetical protein WBQ55_18320, partial [Xanthobacteraceae bacterium]